MPIEGYNKEFKLEIGKNKQYIKIKAVNLIKIF